MIQLTDLVKEFDDLAAVSNLTLTVPEGEIYGLIGPNGAGKTTTIRMACGLLSPTDGSVTIAGVNVIAEPENAQQNIGYLSDFFAVYEDLRVWEYLDYFARAYKLPTFKVAESVARVMSQVGLETKRDSPIAGLSRGMKQRLGIARGIIHQPKVLLLDEPASGLDPKARFELRELLRGLRDAGTTILISSHILTELEDFCTSIGIMEKGRLVRSGRIEDVIANETSGRKVQFGWIGNCRDIVLACAQRVPSITKLQLQQNEGTFFFTGNDEDLAGFLTGMVTAGVPVISFTETKQTVEDFYMKVARHEVM